MDDGRAGTGSTTPTFLLFLRREIARPAFLLIVWTRFKEEGTSSKRSDAAPTRLLELVKPGVDEEKE